MYWSTRPTHSLGRQESLFSQKSSVCPHFSKSGITNKVKTMFATGETVGLAEWIIDDPCLVFYFFSTFFSLSEILSRLPETYSRRWEEEGEE